MKDFELIKYLWDRATGEKHLECMLKSAKDVLGSDAGISSWQIEALCYGFGRMSEDAEEFTEETFGKCVDMYYENVHNHEEQFD